MWAGVSTRGEAACAGLVAASCWRLPRATARTAQHSTGQRGVLLPVCSCLVVGDGVGRAGVAVWVDADDARARREHAEGVAEAVRHGRACSSSSRSRSAACCCALCVRAGACMLVGLSQVPLGTLTPAAAQLPVQQAGQQAVPRLHSCFLVLRDAPTPQLSWPALPSGRDAGLSGARCVPGWCGAQTTMFLLLCSEILQPVALGVRSGPTGSRLFCSEFKSGVWPATQSRTCHFVG